MPIDSTGTPDPRGFDTDFNGQVPTDPRGHRTHQAQHWRSQAEVDRAAYDGDVPDNGNRRRHNDASNKGAHGNDLTTGRTGQDKGW